MPARTALADTTPRATKVRDRFRLAFSRLFTFLSPDESDAMFARAELIDYAPGDVILPEGAPSQALFIVAAGEAKVTKREYPAPERAVEVELAHLGLGSMIGEMSFLERDLASATVIAETPAKLYRFDRDSVLDLIENMPGFSANFYRSLAVILSRRLRVANTALSSSDETRAVARKDRFKIFVVDDDPHVLEFVRLFLEHSGHTVRTSTLAIESIPEILHFRPDLLLTDLMMSGMDGLEFCKELRKRRELTAMKIVMISVWSETVWTEKALAVGANGFISKPLNPETFAMQIERVMRPVSSSGV